MRVNTDVSVVRRMLRLFIDARAMPCERARERHLSSGLGDLIGAAIISVVLDAEHLSAAAEHCPGLVHASRESHSSRPCEAPDGTTGVFDRIIRTIARITPLEPGSAITATLRDLVVDLCCPGVEHEGVEGDVEQLGHAMYSTVRLRAQSWIHGLGLYRRPFAPAFTCEERSLVHVFHAMCESVLLTSDHDRVAAASGVSLSRRERETLDLVLCGLADKEIAERLGISRHTVNQYVKAIFRHYEVTSRAQLMARLLSHPQGQSLNLGK